MGLKTGRGRPHSGAPFQALGRQIPRFAACAWSRRIRVSDSVLEADRRSALDVRTIALGEAWAGRGFALCFWELEALRAASRRLVERRQLRAAQAAAAP